MIIVSSAPSGWPLISSVLAAIAWVLGELMERCWLHSNLELDFTVVSFLSSIREFNTEIIANSEVGIDIPAVVFQSVAMYQQAEMYSARNARSNNNRLLLV
ncbi:hypothetical protein CY34DRAFT_752078 [Suillus luteus UH-Slu-Lm8-n1]|uniref:Uncharacterized protein n=1 Tax=Suillus luteus UH-Slu-Lm8-n1 TaxID=930992 RepID=A0A0D0A3J4_9AGAM|nr:hypothetical protein CY34DRAFT_752078 [Suillus luteus UH-Slu-Lm8-n1]